MPKGLLGLVPMALAMASIALASCGQAEPSRQPASAAPSDVQGISGTQSMTMIEMVSGARRWRVRLADSPSSRDFLVQLPLKLTLKDYAGTEKIADLPRKLTREGAPAAITPIKGDVTFYAPWGNLAIFYEDGQHSPGLVHLGRIEGDIAGLSGSAPMEVSIRTLP